MGDGAGLRSFTMKNKTLESLNFTKLIKYDDIPDVRNRPTCTGYCVSCEQNGYLEDPKFTLFQMSHGADTEDFENAIKKLPEDGFDVPVVFLLESPGGHYANGKPVPYKGYSKEPPVNCYYWLPKPMDEWPTAGDDVDPGSYGKYFAYILAAHRLRNAYFTNVVKCSLAPRDKSKTFIPWHVTRDQNHWHSKIRSNCFELYLKEELRLLQPKIVFFFGGSAKMLAYYSGIYGLLPKAWFQVLRHPADRRFGHKEATILPENDKVIAETIQKWKAANS